MSGNICRCGAYPGIVAAVADAAGEDLTMLPFGYAKARTEQEAIPAAAAGGRYIAGGTTLIDLMREEVERPEHLVDINALPLATFVSKAPIW